MCINGFCSEHPWKFKSVGSLWFYFIRGITEDRIELEKCLACEGI